MNFTSPKSRLEATNQIYKCAVAGRDVRDSPTKVDNLLRNWDISHERHDEIRRCAQRDLQALAPTENGLHIHTFLKECFDIDTNKSKKAAYGDWTKNEPFDRCTVIYPTVCAGEQYSLPFSSKTVYFSPK